ncbi:unnamed protein product, partial [Symbiodinium sp. CCMP2456]
VGSSTGHAQSHVTLSLCLSLVSVNVQSLCEDETRAKATATIVSGSHIRFLSSRDSTPVKFEVGDFRVLHWSPRILIVRFARGTLRLLFVTCHVELLERLTFTPPRRTFDVSWSVGVHEHYHIVAKHVLSSLAKKLPVQRSHRRILPVVTSIPGIFGDGSLASTPAEAEARWLRCLARHVGQDLDMLDVCRRDLPTRCELERALRASKPGRAAGNDGMPPDVLHFCASQLSDAIYPILLKIAFRLQEPIQFKGGTVRQIYKQKGDLAECARYRGILISSTIGKSIHAAFRRKWLDSAASPLQVGGRRGFPVQLAAQAARDFQAGHLKRGRSTALVFLDLREAFHRVARPLVHGGDLSDEHLASVISSFGLPHDHLHRLRDYVQAESLLVSAGASDWAAAVVKEFQTDSWLTIGEGLAVVESGTRPGDALADVVFAFLFSSVLQKVRQAIFAAGYEVVLPWAASWFRQLSKLGCSDGTLAPIDVAWMDDLVILLSSSTPEGALAATKGAATALIDEEKALLFQSLVLSRLLYGAGTWSYQDDTIEQRIQGVLLAMARQMLFLLLPEFLLQILLHVERLRHLAVVRLSEWSSARDVIVTSPALWRRCITTMGCSYVTFSHMGHRLRHQYLDEVPVDFTPEVDRADDSVLCSLEDLFCCEDQGYSYDALLQAVRAVFAGVCLQVSRLKATAREWRCRLTSELQDNEDVSINWSTWHRRIADWICDVDFVEWLVFAFGSFLVLVGSLVNDLPSLLYGFATSSVPGCPCFSTSVTGSVFVLIGSVGFALLGCFRPLLFRPPFVTSSHLNGVSIAFAFSLTLCVESSISG